MHYQTPTYHHEKGEIPVSNIGKVLRRVLRDEEIAKESSFYIPPHLSHQGQIRPAY